MSCRIRFVVSMLFCGVGVLPGARGAEVAWVPVSATGPHILSGQKIVLPYGDMFVTFEGRLSNWDPNGDGQLRLQTYQMGIETSGFSAGEVGTVELRSLPCASDDDCYSEITCGGAVPGVCDDALGGTQSWLYIDIFHPNFAFANLATVTAVDSAGLRFGSTVFGNGDSVPDLGVPKYGATLILYVPAEARGTFELAFRLGTGSPDTFISVYDGDRSEGLIPDFISALVVVGIDCNDNGTPDLDDIASGASLDCNGNSIPDECESDCNDNGNPDDCDIEELCSRDCDDNGVPDECEPDCNGNGIQDVCDVNQGASEDCDADMVPDECTPSWHQDCNGNAQPDWCDVAVGGAADCNNNGVPDSCDLADGTSADCNQDGSPDECEPDCNSNGIADACDIASGFSADANLDGVPDECAVGFSLEPVSASRGYVLSGNEIFVPVGASQVTIEGRTFGWDPDMDGDPLLYLYQYTILTSSFSSGTAGTLTLAKIPCATDDDCRQGMRCGVIEPGFCETINGISSAVYVDVLRDDFVFAGRSTFADAAINTTYLNYGASAGSRWLAVADTGERRYAGTLMLDVPDDARGTFGIDLRRNQDGTEMHPASGGNLPIQVWDSAWITILEDCNENGVIDTDDIASGNSVDCDQNGFPDECDLALGENMDCNGNFVPDVCESTEDCNGNGVIDFCDLLAGTSADVNANGVPDECEAVTPISEASGGRYLVITPTGTPNARVALRVTSHDFPCMEKYVSKTGGVAGLSDVPTYLLTGDWGTVVVGDDAIVPAATYEIVADHDDGVASAPAVLSTPPFGDLAPPFGTVDFRDIAASVAAFLHDSCAVAMEQADLFPAAPDGVVDFRDIAMVVTAYVGEPYPFAEPCP